MMTRIRFRVFIFIACSQLLLYTPLSSQVSSDEEAYYNAKKNGDYVKAVTVLTQWSQVIKSPELFELNIFRIYELMDYPELFEKGIAAFKELQSLSIAKTNIPLRDRITLFLGCLSFKKGDLSETAKYFEGLGYMGFYAIGPFKNNSSADFEGSHPVEKEFIPRKAYQGLRGSVSWFSVLPNRTGCINFRELVPSIKDTFFYLYNEFAIPGNGPYTLILGKTGYTDIWIDGTKIFSSRARHGFRHDQYFIKLSMAKGRHTLLIKTGDSPSGLKLAVRMCDSKGIRINRFSSCTGTIENSIDHHSVSVSYFPSLQHVIDSGDKDASGVFHAGYLTVMARISTPYNHDSHNYLSAIDSSSPYFSPANYYLARIQKSPETKELFYRKSYQHDTANLESLIAMIHISIHNNHCAEAYQLIEKLNKNTNGIPYHLLALADLYKKKKWFPELYRLSHQLQQSSYPSAGIQLKSHYYMIAGEYSKVTKLLRSYLALYETNTKSIRKLLHCYSHTGNHESEEKILQKAIGFFPNSIRFRLSLARLISANQGTNESIPVLSSALKLSPLHSSILRELAYTYHFIGKNELAHYYLSQSLAQNPDDTYALSLFRLLANTYGSLDHFLYKGDARELVKAADSFTNEPAVFLLDETAIELQQNGSYEKRVRKIIQVNRRNAFDDFKDQYIIIDPKLESVENIQCQLIKGSNRLKITGAYAKSLSDPESRVYYDLSAIIIPINSLEEGSVIDFSYTLKNKGGDIYRNYFGNKCTIGSNYRTLKTQITLIAPENKTLQYNGKGLDTKKCIVSQHNHKKIYHCTINNSPPYKKESGMPSQSDIFPSLSFSSMQSWNELCQWYISLMRERLVMSDEMRRDINRIVSPSDTPLEKIRKIYEFVTREIRYVGFEFGLGGVQPRSTDVTYHTKMGDCKDVALLLVVLLRHVGIDARLALVRTRDRGIADTSIPLLDEFNHALCYVNYGGGIFLDGTTNYTGIQELPSGDRDVTTLVMNDHASSAHGTLCYSFINTKNAFYNKDSIEITNIVYCNADGSLTMKRKLLKQGSLATEARRSLYDAPDVKTASLNEYWNKIYPGSKVTHYEVLRRSIGQPLVYQYDVSIPAYIRAVDNDIIIEPFSIKSDYYSSYCISSKRSFPIQFPSPLEIQSIHHIHIPEGYRATTLPKNQSYEHNKFSAYFTYSQKGGIITVSSKIIIKEYSIEKNEYPQFKEFSRMITIAESEKIIFTKSE